MENEIKNWSVLGKGYETHDLCEYTYITKKFTGTEKEFDEFCSSLYDTIEGWKEIDSGESKKRDTECFKLTGVKFKDPKKKDYSNSFEDSFNRVKKFKYIG